MTNEHPEEELTEAQKAKKRIKDREVGLLNLENEELTTVAVANAIETGEYGKAISATYQTEYLSAMQNGSKPLQKAILGSLISSRQDKKSYSGHVSEAKIMGDCAEIIQASLERVKVGDVLKLIGSKERLNSAYEGKYVFQLAESKNKNYQKLYNQIIAGYTQFMVDKGISEALGKQTKAIKGGLEALLVGGPKLLLADKPQERLELAA